MNLGYAACERSIRLPALNADVGEIASFRRASLVKTHGVGFDKKDIIGT